MAWQWSAMIFLAVWSAAVWIHEAVTGSKWDDWDDGFSD